MQFVDILYYIIIKPLEIIFEIIFSFGYKLTANTWMSITVMSLVVNFLALPMYLRADKLQEKQINLEKKLEKWTKHIKKHFKGEERFLMLQNYYRENNYRPVSSVISVLPLLLQIPIFVSAYRFLSGLQILEGAGLGPIKNLAKPDELLHIGSFGINILPILMTLINMISGYIYSQGRTLKEKLQLYLTAVVFLLLLYESPSGLVYYWTLNNVFSLCKNIVIKKGEKQKKETKAPHQTFLFLISAIELSLLVGVMIPSTVIATSPSEFVDTFYFRNPLFLVLRVFLTSLGLFFFWLGILYFLSGKKSVFERVYFAVAQIALLTYMYFGSAKKFLSSFLQYKDGLSYSTKEIWLNIFFILLIILVCIFTLKRFKSFPALAGTVFSLVIILNSANKVSEIYSVYGSLSYVTDQSEDLPKIKFSKEGKNVVVLMLDRAMATQVQYIFNERKELFEKFDGFTFYPNTVSFGAFTNFGIPGIYGGYEYTPDEMNKRSDELLADKHNEALKVMPVLFDSQGYEVTVCHPPYAGYLWEPDLSIYDDYPGIKAYSTKGRFLNAGKDEGEYYTSLRERNLFYYGIMRCSPCFIQKMIYDNGRYLSIGSESEDKIKESTYSIQTMDGIHKSTGLSIDFMKEYTVLTNLTNITEITSDTQNEFLLMANGTTHEPMLLQAPDYVPAYNVDNTVYDEERKQYQVIDGIEMSLDTEDSIIHYYSNVAAYLRLAEWFDYLRENDVYDNTRIILVSDHGRGLEQFENMDIEDGRNIEWFTSLLMVKDFDSHGFNISDDFMTNADVPSIATTGVISNPVNPFTGNKIDSAEKYKHEQHIIFSEDWDVHSNNGTTFNPGEWYYVHDNIYDPKNWSYDGYH